MFFKLIFTIFLTFYCSIIGHQFSNDQQHSRIINGDIAEITDFPFMAIVSQKVPFHLFCGGIIVTEYFLLSAAHCFRHEQKNGTFKYSDINNYKIFVGSDNLTDFEKGIIEGYEIKRIYYSKDENDDIVILKLKKPLSFDDKIRAACLNLNDEKPKKFKNLVVSGWGRTNGNKTDISNILRKSYDLNDISFYPNDTIKNPKIIEIAGKKLACNGDSGGPLSVDKSDYKLVVGIVSYGFDLECVTDFYVRLSYHSNWIKKITNVTNDCDSFSC